MTIQWLLISSWPQERRSNRVAGETGRRSDFGELARRSLIGTISTAIADGLPGLFESNSSDVQAATAKLGRSQAFSGLSRSFFTRLLSDTLKSWLARVLSAKVGPDKRFPDMGDRSDFDTALTQYSMEATRIIKEFSGGWYGVTLHRNGEISSERAAAFSAVAFKKITEELKRKQELDE